MLINKDLHQMNFDESQLYDADTCIPMLNLRYAFVIVGGKPRVVDEYKNELSFLPKETFVAKYANILISGEKLGEYWWNHPERRQYINGVVFEPSGNCLDGEYNIWRGYPIAPDSTASCLKILWHIQHIICSSDITCYEYVMDWLALMVQHPDKLPGTAICMLSKPGTGKGLFMQYVGRIFDTYYQHVTNTSALTGRFTGHLEKAVLVFADEVSWTSDKNARGQLKTLITEPERLLERKGIDASKVKNCAHIVMASNDRKAIPAELGDRRYFIVEVSDQKVGDHQYFTDLVAEMNSGGPAALLHLLLCRPISNFKPSAFPVTSARIDQILDTLDPVQKWYYEALDNGLKFARGIQVNLANNPGTVVAKDAVYQLYVDWHKINIGYSPESKKALTQVLSGFGVTSTRPNINGQRPNCYVFPDLSTCRGVFESVIGSSIYWSTP